MGHVNEEYTLSDEDVVYDLRDRSRRVTERWVRLIMALLLAFSLAYNGFQARSLIHEKARPDHCRSNFSGLGYDTAVTYYSNPERNHSANDDLWDRIDPSPFAIVLDEKQAKAYGLGPSVPFPWDDEKNIYYIKAFHHVHCLKVIRGAFKTWERGEIYPPAKREHLHHCIDALRQDVMCKPDDTIMASRSATHVIGDGQTFQCRSWDKLVKWAQAPERNACFRVFDDDRHVSHQLEVYSFCPKDSPFYDTVHAYYAKHGHKPIYEEGDKLSDSY